MKPIQHVFSIGTTCYTRWLLQREGLTRESGPFDWLFSDLRIVTHCIEDGFNEFLDRTKYFRVEGGSTTQYGHLFYSPMSTNKGPTIFNHHDVSLEHNYEHFKRAASRFRDVLASNDSALFATFSPPNKLDVALFRNVVNAIGAKRTNFKVLAVILNPPNHARTAEPPELVERIDDSELYKLRVTSGHVSGLSFANDADNDLVASTFAHLQFDPPPAGRLMTTERGS